MDVNVKIEVEVHTKKSKLAKLSSIILNSYTFICQSLFPCIEMQFFLKRSKTLAFIAAEFPVQYFFY